MKKSLLKQVIAFGFIFLFLIFSVALFSYILCSISPVMVKKLSIAVFFFVILFCGSAWGAIYLKEELDTERYLEK